MFDALRSIIQAIGPEKINYINVDARTMVKLRAEAADASDEHITELKSFMGVKVYGCDYPTTTMYLELRWRS